MQGGISAGVIDSDNVFLAPDPDAQEETIFQVVPSLEIGYDSRRIDASLRYRFEWNDYSDIGESCEFHRYDANLTGTLVEDALYFDIGGSRDQSIIDPDSAIPSNSLPISSNVVDRDQYFISPRLEKTFGGSITLNMSYRYEDQQFDDSPDVDFTQDHTNESARFEINNYAREEGLSWALKYASYETEYDSTLPWEHEQASAELGFWANGRLRVFAVGGQESAWDDPVDRSLQDTFWEAGFAYKKGDRVSAEFAAGERSFGTSWRGQVEFGFRFGQLDFSYAEVPTTIGFDQYAGGRIFDPDEPGDVLTRPGGAERYVSERGQIGLTLTGRRTSLAFYYYDQLRSGRYLADGTPLDDEQQSGINVSLNWELGAKTSLAASGYRVKWERDTGSSQQFDTASVTLGYRLASSLSLSLGYSYSEQVPTTGSEGYDYAANITSLYLSYTF